MLGLVMEGHMYRWPKILISSICHIQPLGVTKTATFIVDLDVLFSDLKADDLGTWNANGTK